MSFDSLQSLPPEVREELLDEKYIQIEEDMYDQFGLNGAQIAVYCDILPEFFLKKRPATDLPEQLLRLPDAQSLDLRGFALAIATNRLWPINHFLGSVDLLIRRLGGVAPAPVAPRVLEEDEASERIEGPSSEASIQGIAKDVLQRYKSFGDLYLTQKPIRDSEERLKAPTVNNWLQDYLHTVGADGTGSLKRSKYLTKSVNALGLNEAEKQNLLNFLVSYEENALMYWRIAEEQYLLIETEMPEAKQRVSDQGATTKQMSELVNVYTTTQQQYRELFEEKKKALELEINGNNKKTADIVWDALGLNDTDRCLAALDLLIDHHWLLETLKTDHRFQGIVSRHIGVRYGIEAKNTWNGDLTTAVLLTVLWKLLLVEKLNFEEMQGAILADYFRKKLDLKISPIYLDLKSGKFLFREVVYKDRAFSFV